MKMSKGTLSSAKAKQNNGRNGRSDGLCEADVVAGSWPKFLTGPSAPMLVSELETHQSIL